MCIVGKHIMSSSQCPRLLPCAVQFYRIPFNGKRKNGLYTKIPATQSSPTADLQQVQLSSMSSVLDISLRGEREPMPDHQLVAFAFGPYHLTSVNGLQSAGRNLPRREIRQGNPKGKKQMGRCCSNCKPNTDPAIGPLCH